MAAVSPSVTVDNSLVSIGTNWARYYEYAATTLHSPSTIDELSEIVATAPKIRALGSRHSFNDLADSAELVSLDRLPPDIRIDEESETVSFSAGVRYGDLAAELELQGWALRNMASLPHISVAGAVATSTHGSGDRNGTLARAVSGLEFVTATGELLAVTPVDEAFDGAVVSLGALGVVARITLDIEPSYEMRQQVYSGITWEHLLDNYDAITARAYSVSIFTDWSDDARTTVWLKGRLDERALPQDVYGAKPLADDVRLTEGSAQNTTRQGGEPGPWNERLPHFRMGFSPSNGDELQTEYFVPRQDAIAALRAVRALGDRITPHLHITELRTMAADSLWLSGAYGTDATAIHFTWKNEPSAVLPLLPVIEAALEPFGARPHWGKLFASVRRERYPRLDDFVALAHDFDPNGKFRNTFLDRNVF
ncbi:MAG: FAD-binding protein [Salinibacterium sp.]|nr:FAD-binding protein [Salinibacterium sp.]